MSSENPRRVTLPQVLALIAIWTAVIYGVTAKRPADAEQISLKGKLGVVACAKGARTARF
jgi:hypothetical protein